MNMQRLVLFGLALVFMAGGVLAIAQEQTIRRPWRQRDQARKESVFAG